MASRRKYKPFPTWTILVILFGIIIVGTTSFTIKNPDNQIQGLVPVVLLFSVVIAVLVFGALVISSARRKAKLRAITISGIDNMTGVEFERYVGEILKSQAYKVSYTKTSGDFGVDIIAHKDGAGTAIQIKRYAGTVGRSAISDAVAGMNYYKCEKALVITSSYFTREAKALAESNSCELVDREKLMEWIYDFQTRNRESTTLPQSLG